MKMIPLAPTIFSDDRMDRRARRATPSDFHTIIPDGVAITSSVNRSQGKCSFELEME
jgi:hypothetical protein